MNRDDCLDNERLAKAMMAKRTLPNEPSIASPREVVDRLTQALKEREAEADALRKQLEEARAENIRLAISRDKQFWREYADDTCRNLLDSNAKFGARLEEARQEVERLREAVQSALKLPRPWMDGGISYEEWDAAFSKVEAALTQSGGER